jgi:hypothetical protein
VCAFVNLDERGKHFPHKYCVLLNNDASHDIMLDANTLHHVACCYTTLISYVIFRIVTIITIILRSALVDSFHAFLIGREVGMTAKLNRIWTVTTILRYTVLVGAGLFLTLPWSPITPIIVIAICTLRHRVAA